MKISRAVVPSLFTLLNIFCGFVSIIESSQRNYGAAVVCILAAAVFDSLDGIMARLTNSCSQFGVELDSLADVVSFGAAPAFMAYQVQLSTFGSLGLLLAALPALMGAVRLARFNVQLVGFSKDYFTGLPIPMQAITVCAFVLNYKVQMEWTPLAADIFAPLVVLLSLLMVSTIRYDTLPKLSKKQLAAHPWRIGSMVVGLLLAVLSGGKLLFFVLMCFILYGVIHAIVMMFKKNVLKGADIASGQQEYSRIDL
jgi:CDP-diacylglycerol--serine O-phosphatidyltransferase